MLLSFMMAARARIVMTARALSFSMTFLMTLRALCPARSSSSDCMRAACARACQGGSNRQGSNAVKESMYEAQWFESRAALQQQQQRALRAQMRALQHPLQRQQRRAAIMRTVRLCNALPQSICP